MARAPEDGPAVSGGSAGGAAPINGWYELFSRGTRDWLRHSEKIREAVREQLPQIVAGTDIINHGARTVRVPVRMLEHYRFRLSDAGESQGVGQGKVKPGDVLARPGAERGPGQKGAGGLERGGVELMLEFKIDDIIDWLWDELQLPNLQVRTGQSEDPEWKREGWDRRGARSRLDRRRSLKEAVKRRGPEPVSPAFVNEDLRFRQLARRSQPALRAVVFFALDVSGSMTERDRQLAKTFFFWVAAGLRREYQTLDIVFIAHTTDAWEFSEAEFFKVAGTGGTIASSAFAKVREIVEARFDPSLWNVYLFYASDGDNATTDRARARGELEAIVRHARYSGYVEISGVIGRNALTETFRLFDALAAAGAPCARFSIGGPDDVSPAVRHFFSAEARAAERDGAAGGTP